MPAFIEGSRPGSVLLWLDGRPQSVVDPEDPTWLGFDYLRRIGDLIDVVVPAGEPIRALHVGGAAMALPRYVAHTRPRSAQIVLEPDAELTAHVRRRLPLPPRSGIKVRPVDGATGVRAMRDATIDVLVLDAFAGGEVPPELVGLAFLGEVSRVLTEDGLLAANLIDAPPFPLVRSAVAALRAHFRDVTVGVVPATLKKRHGGNVVVLAGRRVPVAQLRQRAASGDTPYRIYEGTAVLDSFGGGRPLP